MTSHPSRTGPEPDAAVVGLGAMGLPMAIRLNGWGRVVGVDPSEERRMLAEGASMQTAASLAKLPPPGLVVVMVSTADQLTQVVANAPVTDHQTWILMGTYGSGPVELINKQLAARGAQVVDAPVTGGVRGAEDGALHIFCAGSRQALRTAQAPLGQLGTPHEVSTTVGAGQRLKAINQLLCSVHLSAAAEAVALAQASGLDASMTIELLTLGAASSWMLQDRAEGLLSPQPPPVRSTVDVFVKDSGIAHDLGAAAGVATPLLDAARTQFLRARDSGLGHQDDSQVILIYQSPPLSAESERS